MKSFDEKLQQAQILIKCSKGTYIRSIANDLGKELNSGGYLTKLVRTQAGNFRIENSINLGEINIEKNIINPLEIMNLPKINVESEDLERIRHGMGIKITSKDMLSNVILVYNNNEICAVGYADGGIIKLKKVFI